MAVRVLRAGATQFSSDGSWVQGTAPADGDTAVLTTADGTLLSFASFSSATLDIEFDTASNDQNFLFSSGTAFSPGITFNHVAGNVNVSNQTSGADDATFNLIASGGRVTFSSLPGTPSFNGSGTFNVANGDTLRFGTLPAAANYIVARDGTAHFNVSGGTFIDYAGHNDGRGGRETVNLSASGEFDAYTGSIVSAPNVQFLDDTGSVVLHANGSGPDEFGNSTVGGFVAGDTLELARFSATSISNTAAGAVTLSGFLGSSQTLSTVDLTVTGYGADTLGFFVDSNGNTFLTPSNFGEPPCFARDTRIATVDGPVTVQELSIGDRVVTAAGVVRPIIWIGHRSYAGRFLADNPDILPVVIRASALADGVPSTDLVLSPKHAVLLDGVLVPAGRLIDGHSIVQLGTVESIEYWHVELETHDVLVANGAPAESFVDCDSRALFHNAASFDGLYPKGTGARWTLCAPLIDGGELLEAIRAKLAARGGKAMSRAVVGTLSGHIEHADLRRVRGWAIERENPEPVLVEVLDGPAIIATALADLRRPDLTAAGLGACGFDIPLSSRLSPFVPHEIIVRRAVDGAQLGASWAMEPLVAVAS